MRKFAFTTIFFFFFIFANGQYSIDKLSTDYSNQVLKCAIESNSLKKYNNVIVSEIDTSVVEFTLRNLKTKKKVFKSIDTAKTEIVLKEKEKKFILISFKQQNKSNWSNEDFANIDVIKKAQIKEYVKNDKLNGYIYISAPIFIRNGTVAIVFFANFYGELDKSGGGINNLSFYKLKNGSWKKWITLESGIYN